MTGQPRRWIKTFCNDWLRGTIRFACDAAERGVAADLDALAGDCGMDGLIAVNETLPFTRSWIAGTLNITPKLLERTLEKLKKLPTDEYYYVIEDSTGIRLVNWYDHQPKLTEYQRQKPSRDKRKGLTEAQYEAMRENTRQRLKELKLDCEEET